MFSLHYIIIIYIVDGHDSSYSLEHSFFATLAHFLLMLNRGLVPKENPVVRVSGLLFDPTLFSKPHKDGTGKYRGPGDSSV